MKRIAETALSLSLLVLGCDKADRDGIPSGDGTSTNLAIPDPRAIDTSPSRAAVAGEVPIVRLAELEIDPTQLESYKAAVKEEMETSVREEPGVLAIYAVAEKDNLSKLRFFKIYADDAAYKAHIDSAHFRKYVKSTKDMIISKRLIDTVPVQLDAKKR